MKRGKDLSNQPNTGDVSVSIGGDMSGQLVIGHGNQLYNYSYNVAHGGVLNVAAPPAVKPRPTPLALKPAPFPNLLDRQDVLPTLRETLKQQLPVELYANEGMGKTVLMRHIAHDEQISLTFRDGVVYLPIIKQPATDLLQALYDAFYWVNPPFKPSYAQVQQALKDKQALIILNGMRFEKADAEWLMAALPDCTFVLVSNERLYWQEGAAIALKGLPLTESIELMRTELGRKLSEAERSAAKALWTALSGHPLELRRAASEAKDEDESLVALMQSMQSMPGETLSNQSLFQSMLIGLSDRQKKVLALMGAVGGLMLNAQEAHAMSGVPGSVPETAEALSELADLHLVESVAEGGYQLCGDLTQTVASSLDAQPFLTKAMEYFTNGAGSAEACASNPDVAMHLLEWTTQTGQWQQSLDLARGLDSVLSTSGQWGQWQQVLNTSLQASQQLGNGAAEAWSLHQLGTRSLAIGEKTQAKNWLSQALKLRQQLGDTAGAAISSHNLGLIVPPIVVGGEPASTASAVTPWFRRYGLLGGIAGGAIAGAAGLALLLPNAEQPATVIPIPEEPLTLNKGEKETVADSTALVLSSQRLNFGETALGKRQQQPLRITNNNAEPVKISLINYGDTEEFGIVKNDCTEADLAPGASCSVVFWFGPKGVGDRTTQVKIASTTGIDSTVTLSGSGTTPTAQQPKNPTPSAASTPTPTTPSAVEPSQPPAETVSEPDPAPEPEPAVPSTPTPEPEPTDPSIPAPPTANQPPQINPNVSVPLEYTQEIQQGVYPLIDLLALSDATDSDPGDTVSLASVGNISELGGELVNNGDGTVTYIPPTPERVIAKMIESGELPEDYEPPVDPDLTTTITTTNRFSFVMTDSQGGSSEGTLTIQMKIPQPL